MTTLLGVVLVDFESTIREGLYKVDVKDTSVAQSDFTRNDLFPSRFCFFSVLTSYFPSKSFRRAVIKSFWFHS